MNAACAREYTDASSPIESSRNTVPGSSCSGDSAHCDRRIHCTPRLFSKSATSPKRSGCRGARIVTASAGSASSSSSSSPLSVDPQTSTRAPGARDSPSISVMAEAAAARTSYFRLPPTRTFAAPKVVSLSASSSLCASASAKPPSRRRHIHASLRYRGHERSEMRAFTTATGIFLRRHSTSMRGQNSVSISTSRRGCRARSHARTAQPRSRGK